MGDTREHGAGNYRAYARPWDNTLRGYFAGNAGVDSDILYTHLFGKGEHNHYQFDDAELWKIDERVKESNSGKAYLTFHGARMYSDAARLKVYQKSDTVPKVTKAIGLASLRSVLEDDAKFPAAKSELIEKQGWKVFDLPETELVHASMLLNKLPEIKFAHVEEVIEALKNRLEKRNDKYLI